MWRLRFRICRAFVPALLLLLCFAVNFCAAQTDDVLCRGGSGNFGAEHDGIAVHVGASKVDGLATRTCDATLSWGEQKVVVATAAWEVDLDVFGADLGMGVPVAAFQVKKSDAECCRTYLIYSLQKPPRLLRTLTGGSSYGASDTDLDTRAEVWTDDSAAVDGFEGLTLSELEVPPRVALRFEHSQLLDVGAEFQTYFDRVIANLRTKLDPRDLQDFKGSDGKLKPNTDGSPEHMHRLRRVKIGILEIVWAYLYSGREQGAWSFLGETWPGVDLERIRAAIVQARNRGMRAQVDGMGAQTHGKKRATIFDVTVEDGTRSGVVRPRPILLRRPPPPASVPSSIVADVTLDLVVDGAGKVRSVEPAGDPKSVDADLMRVAMGWKFIPALNGGHAVASRTRLVVSVKR